MAMFVDVPEVMRLPSIVTCRPAFNSTQFFGWPKLSHSGRLTIVLPRISTSWSTSPFHCAWPGISGDTLNGWIEPVCGV